MPGRTQNVLLIVLDSILSTNSQKLRQGGQGSDCIEDLTYTFRRGIHL